MSVVYLFDCVRLRYAEMIGVLNGQQIQPPNAAIFKAMVDLDTIVRPGYHQHTDAELTTIEASIQTLDAFIGPGPAGERWDIFKAQARSYLANARAR